jgi:hypothetical protein
MILPIIDGTFTKEDAERIVKEIFEVKINYHKLKSLNDEESLRRLNHLQNVLETCLDKIRQHPSEKLTIHADIEMNIFEPFHQ